MHAAENDVFCTTPRGFFRSKLAEFEAVTGKVGMRDDVILLVVMTENEQIVSESLTLSDEILRVRFIRVGLPWWGVFADPRQVGRQ